MTVLLGEERTAGIRAILERYGYLDAYLQVLLEQDSDDIRLGTIN